MESYPIRRIIEEVSAGQIRIPAFQRDFVWDPDRIALYIDSLYKSYPFGSLLFWRARELLVHERKLAPTTYPSCDRIIRSTTSWMDSNESRQSSPHSKQCYLVRAAISGHRSTSITRILWIHKTQASSRFPMMRQIRNSSSPYQCSSTRRLIEMQPKAFRLRHNEDRRPSGKTQGGSDPSRLVATDDRATVAIVFERINHQGIPLDTLQLLTAWTWSDDFDLQDRFEQLRETLEDHGFAGVGEDTSLVLRCCAAILTGQPTVDSLID